MVLDLLVCSFNLTIPAVVGLTPGLLLRAISSMSQLLKSSRQPTPASVGQPGKLQFGKSEPYLQEG